MDRVLEVRERLEDAIPELDILFLYIFYDTCSGRGGVCLGVEEDYVVAEGLYWDKQSSFLSFPFCVKG